MDVTTRGREVGWLWKIVSVVAEFGIATTGWALVMTAILSFIGIPLFILGLALMHSAEQW
jgi:hypothetical protein